MCVGVCDSYKERTCHEKSAEIPKTTASLSITRAVLCVSLCLVYKLNSSLLHAEKFLLHIVSGFFYEDNLINRLSSKLISCGNEARGTGVSTPEDFAIPADSRARLIISQ